MDDELFLLNENHDYFLLTEGAVHVPSADGKAPGVIKNARVLGERSANGNNYTIEAMRKGAHLYNGVRVNIDHNDPRTPNKPRSFRDRFGKITNARFDEASRSIRGDIEYNPEHPDAKQFAWAAVNQPDTFGLSHNAKGMGKSHRASGRSRFRVESIAHVQHVDVVADPATTNGLFESEGFKALSESDQAIRTHLGTVLGNAVRKINRLRASPIGSLSEFQASARAIAKELSKALRPAKTTTESEGGTDVEANEVTLAWLKENRKDVYDAAQAELKDTAEAAKRDAEFEQMKKELAEHKARADRAERVEAMRKKCVEASIPEDKISDTFVESLVDANDDKVDALIEDRKALLEDAKPKPSSRSRTAAGRTPKQVNEAQQGDKPQKRVADLEPKKFAEALKYGL